MRQVTHVNDYNPCNFIVNAPLTVCNICFSTIVIPAGCHDNRIVKSVNVLKPEEEVKMSAGLSAISGILGQQGGSSGLASILGQGSGQGQGGQSQQEIKQLVQQLKSEGVSKDQIHQAFQQAKSEHVSPIQTLSQLAQTSQQNASGGAGGQGGASPFGVDQFTPSPELSQA